MVSGSAVNRVDWAGFSKVCYHAADGLVVVAQRVWFEACLAVANTLGEIEQLWSFDFLNGLDYARRSQSTSEAAINICEPPTRLITGTSPGQLRRHEILNPQFDHLGLPSASAAMVNGYDGQYPRCQRAIADAEV
ncbi:MAG: hypothetical protein AAGD11_14220 [Planctomycetota bacterium]